MSERQTRDEHYGNMVAKLARVRDDNTRQRDMLGRMHLRENAVIQALLGPCDQCRKKAAILLYQSRGKRALRFCYTCADHHWQQRFEHAIEPPA